MRRAAWMSAIAIAWIGWSVARADGPEQEHAFSVAGPLSPDATVELGGRAGPVVIEEALVQNAPGEEDVAGAREGKRARPRPMLVVTNAGPNEARLALELRLEDEREQVLMTCAFQAKVAPGWNELVGKVCRLEEMELLDWPRVKVVRVAGTVRTRP